MFGMGMTKCWVLAIIVYCSGNDFIDHLLMWKVAHLNIHFFPIYGMFPTCVNNSPSQPRLWLIAGSLLRGPRENHLRDVLAILSGDEVCSGLSNAGVWEYI
jgi:hypothetical protein